MLVKGSIAALITPFRGNQQSIDYDALEKLIEWHQKSGSSALVIAGTTGESATIDMQEHIQLIGRAVAIADRSIDIIAGTGANSTAEAIELTKAAKQAGAKACLLVAPYYNKPTQQGLYLHYRSIAEAVDIPQILYNVPARTVSDIQPETVASLAKLENIIGIKDTLGVDRLVALQGVVDDDFILLTGEDTSACDFLLAGGHGGISVTANVAPALNAQMYQLAIDGDTQAAKQLDSQLQPLHQALFIESNPIPVKFACAELGLCENQLRLPLTPLETAHRPTVLKALQAVNESLELL